LEAEVTQLKTDLALSQHNAQAAGNSVLFTHLLHMQTLHLCRHRQGS